MKAWGKAKEAELDAWEQTRDPHPHFIGKEFRFENFLVIKFIAQHVLY